MRRGIALALAVVLQACTASAPSATPTPSYSVAASPTPEGAVWTVGEAAGRPTALESLSPAIVGDVGPLADAVYWGGEDRTGAGDRPGLILGHLDGTHRILVEMGTSARWDGQPVVSTSRQGVALVVVQRGDAWGLQSIDVDRGEATQLVEVDDDLWDAAIDPDATAAYWFVGGDGPTGGVWRIDLATKEITHVLEADPVARAGGNLLAAHVRPLGQLAVGDGMLAALECYHDCRLRLVDLGSGTFRDFSAPAYTGQELMGFVPGGLAFWGGCLLLPDGEVTHQRCPDPDGAEAALESEGAMGFHVVLPSGWRLEVEPVPEAPVMSFEMSALAVSSETGERIPLRVLGTLHGQ